MTQPSDDTYVTDDEAAEFNPDEIHVQRTRDEILDGVGGHADALAHQRAILEVMLDIRDLLTIAAFPEAD